MTISEGKRLGPYEILAAVGAGGMAEVMQNWTVLLRPGK
jgi:hypothetical protein